jgi:hypothetical protein
MACSIPGIRRRGVVYPFCVRIPRSVGDDGCGVSLFRGLQVESRPFFEAGFRWSPHAALCLTRLTGW